MLAQPITGVLAGKKNVLLAGCGGGYDVMGAVPLLHELRAAGVNVHLASLSFAYLNGLDGAAQDGAHPNLYAVTAAAATESKYCPEAWLAAFLDARHPEHAPHTVHSFDKTGVRPLHAAYAALVERLAIDAIVLVDGGIDALLRGDERSIGTPSEDLASLAAVHALDAPGLTRILACVGMGAELRDGICHADALERIAVLTRRRAFLGAAALVPGTPAGDLYLAAVEHVFAGQAALKRSHVHACITSACAGEFGDQGPHIWLSPLLSMFWFFDAAAVAADHVFLPELAGTESIWEVAARVEAARKALPVRDRTTIPL
ncbi:MAG: DUF1152 domain-containing protein [Kofleriaceae bacterium]|nr:MAG: DUF1152 domain-containing protein [Kofleriaceae bacterium]MBZ0234356.1 DUF1152 domain-containing protein [Kofleriaceae bacterium]